MIRVCAGVPAATNRMSVFCGSSLNINSIRVYVLNVNVLCVRIRIIAALHSIVLNNCVFNDGILDDSVIVSRVFDNLGIDLLNGSVPERIFTAVRLLRQRCHRQHTQAQQHRQSCAQPSLPYKPLFTHTIFLLFCGVPARPWKTARYGSSPHRRSGQKCCLSPRCSTPAGRKVTEIGIYPDRASYPAAVGCRR